MLIPKVEKAIDGIVIKFNKMLAQEGPTTFVFPIGAIGDDEINLNMTMTTAPELKVDSHLINLYFDGMFVDP